MGDTMWLLLVALLSTISLVQGFEDCDASLDLMFSVDKTQTFDDDLDNQKIQIPQICDAMQKSIGMNARCGLSSFQDNLWFGGNGDLLSQVSRADESSAYDYAFRVDQNLTDDLSKIKAGVEAYKPNPKSIGDNPESQLWALFLTALAADAGDYGFAPNGARLIAIVTDAAYHKAGDITAFVNQNAGQSVLPNDGDNVVGEFEDYPELNAVKAAMDKAHLIPIFLVAQSLTDSTDIYAVYKDLVKFLGAGAVYKISSTSEDLSSVLVSALVDACGRQISIPSPTPKPTPLPTPFPSPTPWKPEPTPQRIPVDPDIGTEPTPQQTSVDPDIGTKGGKGDLTPTPTLTPAPAQTPTPTPSDDKQVKVTEVPHREWKCESDCVTSCQQCPWQQDLVCGNDQKTYRHICNLEWMANCGERLLGVDLSWLEEEHHGSCPVPDPKTKPDPELPELPKLPLGQCKHACVEDCTQCPFNIDPVCASNGRTYANSCLVEWDANCALKVFEVDLSFLRVSYKGTCPRKYQPKPPTDENITRGNETQPTSNTTDVTTTLTEDTDETNTTNSSNSTNTTLLGLNAAGQESSVPMTALIAVGGVAGLVAAAAVVAYTKLHTVPAAVSTTDMESGFLPEAYEPPPP